MDKLSALLFFFQAGNASQSQIDFFIGTKPFHLWIFANAELLPMLPALIIVGGFIILTLSYVSWRKYKGEAQKRRRDQDKSVD